MRLMTYNILEGGGDRWAALCEVISRQRPDVLAVQECLRFDCEWRSRLTDLERVTGLSGVLFPSRTGFHLALLTPGTWKVLGSRYTTDGFHNGAAMVDVEVQDGARLRLGITHMNPWTEDNRVSEATHLLKWARTAEGVSTILLGDFNGLSPQDELPGSTLERLLPQYCQEPGLTDPWRHEALEVLLEGGFVDTAHVPGPATTGSTGTSAIDVGTTYPTASIADPEGCPPIRIDYCLVTPDLAPHITAWRIVTEAPAGWASDHYPVVVELAWPQSSKD